MAFPVAGMIAVAAVQTGLSMYGAYQEGKAQKKAARRNQAIARAQAKDALLRGVEDEQIIRRYGSQIAGAQRTGFAGQNVVVDDGSALDVALDTAAATERDALAVRSNAMREAWGYEVGAANYGDQARSASRDASMRMAGSALSGGAAAVESYYRMRD